MSLDGFVSDPHGKNDWIFKTGDEESRDWSVEQIRQAGHLIMGRKTFEIIARYWPTATGPFAEPMNTIPKVVFTKNGFAGIPPNAAQSPAATSWVEARIFDGDLAEGIRELKAQPGKPIVALGGAAFMQSLIATGLIDEFNLAIHPVALGSGLSIFANLSTPLYLKLADVKTFPGGTIVHTYRTEG